MFIANKFWEFQGEQKLENSDENVIKIYEFSSFDYNFNQFLVN
jgi:hypothetical protein